MKYLSLIIITMNFFIAQSQPISGRIYEIPIDQGSWVYNIIDLNEVTGFSQEWYRITFLNITPQEPYPDGLQGCEANIILNSSDLGNWSWYPGGIPNIELENSFYILSMSDAIMTVQGENPKLKLYFNGCNINTGGNYSGDSNLIVILESDFPDQDDYGADWNGDGDINIIDVVAIIDFIIFGEV